MFLPNAEPLIAQTDNPYLVDTFIDSDGREIARIIFPGRPPDIKATAVDNPIANVAMGINILSEVPAFDWSYGCSATSAAMLFGYYDRTGYSNMYDGPTNDGLCPLDNSIWGVTVYPSITVGECPLSATNSGVDGSVELGHVDDYWVDYLDPGPDPFIGNWTEHVHGDCTGDYMGTNQSNFGNVDGSTTFWYFTNGDPLYDYTGGEPSSRDGGHGLRLFAESRSYDVVVNYNQYIQGQGTDPSKGFTFDDFMTEIDAGRIVLIHIAGHTMIGLGYDTAGEVIYIHDTWDYSSHQMTWGSTYSGMQHFGVSVIELAPATPPSVTTNDASDMGSTFATLNGYLGDLGAAPSVDVSFEWGDVQGGPYINETIPGMMTTPGASNADISALTKDTTYYFRSKAVGDGTIYGDEKNFTTLQDGPPTMEPLDEAEGQYYNQAPIFANFGFDDDLALDDGWYQLDSFAGTWTELFTDVSGISWDSDGWILPGFDALSEDSHTIYFKASDNIGNVAGASGEWSWQFYIDTTPPDDPTGVSSPSHQTSTWSTDNTVDITWTDAIDTLSNLDGYSILWDTSPDTIPDQVKDIEEAIEATTSPALADGDSHYFHITSVDNAGNWQSTIHLGPFYIAPATPPSVTTNSATNSSITDTSAIINGSLINLGTSPSVDVSFEWGTVSGGPYPNETSPQTMTAFGYFSAGIFGLNQNTTYYFRGKADGDGVSYGAENSFTTFPELLAEISITQALDIDGIALLELNIDRIKDASTGITFELPGGISSYSLTLSGDPSLIEIIEVRGTDNFNSPIYNLGDYQGTGILSISGIASTPMEPPDTVVARIVVSLIGDCLTSCDLTLEFQSIVAADAPALDVPAENPNMLTFLRGDANSDGVVNIVDAMFIAQYLVELRDISEINLVNAASVMQDGSSGNAINIVDAMFIAQYLVEIRDENFEPTA